LVAQAQVLLLPADEAQAARFASLANTMQWQIVPCAGGAQAADTPSPKKP
jgi:hypothetical protein